jgi:hypothetical protein
MVQDLKRTKGATQQLKISGVVECPGKSCHRAFKVDDIMSDLPIHLDAVDRLCFNNGLGRLVTR